MNKTLIRIGGLTAVLGGIYLFLLAGFQAFYSGDFLEDLPIFAYTITLMPLLLLVGAVGLFTLANGRRGVQVGAILIAVSTALMSIGFALMVWSESEMGWNMMFASLIFLPLSLLIFGMANWQAAVLSRWNKLPLITGISATILILVGTGELLNEQQSEMFFGIFLLLLAFTWVAMGLAMLREDGITAVPDAPQISH